jgi:MoaA/NifB/PqqE/SkfB family radical SAM enzyme
VALDEKYIPLIIDFVNENNIENITIGGGEPLIWRHLRKFLEEVLEKTNARIFLLTNGLMINLIEDLLRSSRFNVQISVDAARRETYKRIRGGDFEKLMKNIVKLKEIGVDVALSYTIHSYNKAEVVDFIKKAELVEVNSIHFPIIERYGRAKSNDIIPDSKKIN